MKNLFIYFKNNQVKFNLIGSEVLINRDNMNDAIRTIAINEGLNIFELDNIITIF